MPSLTPDLTRRVALGATGLAVSRLGIGSSYGVDGASIERAYHERGINYLYWGSVRRDSFGEGIRRLSGRHRDDLVVVVQSYSRIAGLIGASLRRALRALRLEYADVLLLGMHNRPVPERLIDAAMKLRASGAARRIGISCHRRSTFRAHLGCGVFDLVMFRYNAAHRGAEKDLFPLLPVEGRPGTVAYTATRWGHLLDPGRLPPGEKVPGPGDCYRFVLSRPEIDVCLTGPADGAQLDEALTALDRGPMDEEEASWMRRLGDHVHAGRRGLSVVTRLLHAGEGPLSTRPGS